MVNAPPPFRADHVGSLVRPPELLRAMHAAESGVFPADELAALQERSIRDAIQLQEAAGLQSVTDGEFRRRSWQRGFMDAVGGFAVKPGPFTFRNDDGVTNPIPASFVERKLERLRGIATEEFSVLKSLTTRTPKVTLPSPTIFHFGLFGGCAAPAAYPEIDALFDDLVAIYQAEIAALAELGCTYLQIDEVAIAALCDSGNRDIVRAQGEDPDRLVDLYIDLDNRVLANRPAGMTLCMHLCRGNQAGLWIAEGGYAPVAEQLFNEIAVDGYFLEYDSPRAGGFEPLEYLPTNKIAMLGLVSTKNADVEDAGVLKRRLDEAARFVPLDRLGLCPQCGFASSISRWNVTENPMTIDIERRKLELIVSVAGDVWGN